MRQAIVGDERAVLVNRQRSCRCLTIVKLQRKLDEGRYLGLRSEAENGKVASILEGPEINGLPLVGVRTIPTTPHVLHFTCGNLRRDEVRWGFTGDAGESATGDEV